jgi:integrase
MQTAFAAYARDHEAASIRRCWSPWNVLCTFLYTGEQLAANPMQLVGRPKLARPLPKTLPRTAVEALLETVAHDEGSKRQTDWAERDLALILTETRSVAARNPVYTMITSDNPSWSRPRASETAWTSAATCSRVRSGVFANQLKLMSAPPRCRCAFVSG